MDSKNIAAINKLFEVLTIIIFLICFRDSIYFVIRNPTKPPSDFLRATYHHALAFFYCFNKIACVK